MGGHVALHKHCAARWINPAGQIKGRCCQGVIGKTGRVMRHGDRMQIDHTHEGVVVVLQINPVADGTEPVAQMKGSGGLDPGENPRPDHESGLFCLGGQIGVNLWLACWLLDLAFSSVQCLLRLALGFGLRCGLRCGRLGLGWAGKRVGP